MNKILLKPEWHWIKYQQAKACCKSKNIYQLNYHLLQLMEANPRATEQLLKALLHQAFEVREMEEIS